MNSNTSRYPEEPSEKAQISMENQSNLVPEEDSAKGFWNLTENLKFTIFLDLNRTHFFSKGKVKTQKVFSLLSEYVSTRTVCQCRSHFQKMIIKYHTISKLRTHFRKLLSPSIYDAQFELLKTTGSEIHEDQLPLATLLKVKKFSSTGVQTELTPQQKPLSQMPALSTNSDGNFFYQFLFANQPFCMQIPAYGMCYGNSYL